jgi:isocitrate dehydrogenase
MTSFRSIPSSSRPQSPSRTKVQVAVAAGDGIGPEILAATRAILDAAGADLDYREITVGESAWRAGETSGIRPSDLDVIRECGVLLKGPVTTPKGSGMKSVNVTIRKTLGLFANVRPTVSYAPFVPGRAGVDVVVVRENEEDLYAGIEHRQSQEVVQCLKLVSRAGCERIARYAFEYARQHGRKRVTSVAKDNIMKLTDGLFQRTVAEIAKEYPEIQYDHGIVDIATARLAVRPENFDVIVTMNLYGDIMSDVAAEVAGSVGMAPSANIGRNVAMFEAIHGSAPDIAGKDLANPSGLLASAVQMLVHLGKPAVAAKIHNAWLRTIEDGVHTRDIHRDGVSTRKVGTHAFAQEVIARLGMRPERLTAVEFGNDDGTGSGSHTRIEVIERVHELQKKVLEGVDVFVQSNLAAEELGRRLAGQNRTRFDLQMITNRGVKVWPNGVPETTCTDHWRCRFRPIAGYEPDMQEVLALLWVVHSMGLEILKTENLYSFDGEMGFSLGQGQ